MKIASLVVLGMMSVGSSVAMGHGFHVDQKEIAATLAAPADLNAAYREEIRVLRVQSERLHRMGQHHEAEATKAQAAKLQPRK